MQYLLVLVRAQYFKGVAANAVDQTCRIATCRLICADGSQLTFRTLPRTRCLQLSHLPNPHPPPPPFMHPHSIMSMSRSNSAEFTQCLAYLKQGRALDVAAFTAWFDGEGCKGAEWIKERFVDDRRGYRGYRSSQPLLLFALRCSAPKRVVLALLAAYPGAAMAFTQLNNMKLNALASALLNYRGNGQEAVVKALIAASPQETKYVLTIQNKRQSPWHIALERNLSEAVVLALAAAFPDAAKLKDSQGRTPLHLAFKFKALDKVAMVVLAAYPGAAAVEDAYAYTPLHYAIKYHASDAVVRAVIASFPGALDRKSKTIAGGGGNTALHMLAVAECSDTAESRHTNTLCFTLAEKRAPFAATNGRGQTPAVAAKQARQLFSTCGQRRPNHHLITSFREIALFKKHTQLSVMHFRDWTTVSHAWCSPSAKLVALTVLMVGETYKRGLLPRLPMDCWYRILNCIPRHELRQGGCEPAEEEAASAKYLAILRTAHNTAQ